MRAVKRESLTLLSTWIARSNMGRPDELHGRRPGNSLSNGKSALDEMSSLVVPPLFDVILADYQNTVPDAREPKVLSLLSIIIVSFKDKVAGHLQRMIEMVFLPTLDMIKDETSQYPEHRVNFFQMVDSATRSCFEEVVNLPEHLLSYIVQSFLWALQHTIRQVAEIGESVLLRLHLLLGITMVTDVLERIREIENDAVKQKFYQTYYMEMLTHVMGVVTDHNQVPFVGLGNLSDAVCQLFVCAENDLKVQLCAGKDNVEFVAETMGQLLSTHFPNLNA